MDGIANPGKPNTKKFMLQYLLTKKSMSGTSLAQENEMNVMRNNPSHPFKLKTGIRAGQDSNGLSEEDKKLLKMMKAYEDWRKEHPMGRPRGRTGG